MKLDLDAKSFLVGSLGAGLADIGLYVPAQVRQVTGLEILQWQNPFVLIWTACATFLAGVIFGLWLGRDISMRQALFAFVITVGLGAAIGMAIMQATGTT